MLYVFEATSGGYDPRPERWCRGSLDKILEIAEESWEWARDPSIYRVTLGVLGYQDLSELLPEGGDGPSWVAPSPSALHEALPDVYGAEGLKPDRQHELDVDELTLYTCPGRFPCAFWTTERASSCPGCSEAVTNPDGEDSSTESSFSDWEDVAGKEGDTREEYGILSLHVSGDDYAALSVEDNVDVDELFKLTILSKSVEELLSKADAYGDVSDEIFVFATAADRSEAMNMTNAALRDNQDYDHSKHHNTFYRFLSTKGLEKYKKRH